jgi:hypothetical protein
MPMALRKAMMVRWREKKRSQGASKENSHEKAECVQKKGRSFISA